MVVDGDMHIGSDHVVFLFLFLFFLHSQTLWGWRFSVQQNKYSNGKIKIPNSLNDAYNLVHLLW